MAWLPKNSSGLFLRPVRQDTDEPRRQPNIHLRELLELAAGARDLLQSLQPPCRLEALGEEIERDLVPAPAKAPGRLRVTEQQVILHVALRPGKNGIERELLGLRKGIGIEACRADESGNPVAFLDRVTAILLCLLASPHQQLDGGIEAPSLVEDAHNAFVELRLRRRHLHEQLDE